MWIVLIILLMLIAAFFLGEYYVFSRTFRSPKKLKNKRVLQDVWSNDTFDDEISKLCDEFNRTPCIYLYTRSFDGLRLAARYYHVKENAPLLICFHGFHGSPVRDNSGTATHLIRRGFNVLAVEERSHHKSEGNALTFGIKERHDVKSWCDFAVHRFGEDVEIFVTGISMGGASVMMASGEDLPKNVKGIAADCPYNSPRDILYASMEKINYKADLLMPFVKIAARIFGRFDLDETSAADEVQHTNVPLMILHGKDDTLVSEKMSEEIYLSNPDMIERHVFDGADHGMSYFVDTKRYLSLLDRFVDRCFGLTSEDEDPLIETEEQTE